MTRRTTVTLTDRDDAGLSMFGARRGVEWTLLQQIAVELGFVLDESSSEATVIRVLMAAGVQHVRDRMLDHGYAQMAEAYADVHDESEARERRRRYAERVDRHLSA